MKRISEIVRGELFAISSHMQIEINSALLEIKV